MKPEKQYRNLATLLREVRKPRPCHCCGHIKKEKGWLTNGGDCGTNMGGGAGVTMMRRGDEVHGKHKHR